MNPPVYSEENIAELRLQGTSVYESERKAFLDVIDHLIKDE